MRLGWSQPLRGCARDHLPRCAHLEGFGVTELVQRGCRNVSRGDEVISSLGSSGIPTTQVSQHVAHDAAVADVVCLAFGVEPQSADEFPSFAADDDV